MIPRSNCAETLRHVTRIYNFSAGPAVLPEEVLAQAAETFDRPLRQAVLGPMVGYVDARSLDVFRDHRSNVL